MENYGQLKVTSQKDNSPLAKVYVKVYSAARMASQVYKDGYN